MHKNLWAIRKELKVTQSDIAKELGISMKQYGEKERGTVSFTLDEAEKMSRIMNVPIDKIFPEYFFTEGVPKMHTN